MKHYVTLTIFILAEWMKCHGEWGFQQPVVYTVYNVNKTWNEANDVCLATNNTLLSMSNETIWEFWKEMFDPIATVPHRTSSRFWFGLHSTHPTNFTANYYWADCTIPQWFKWTSTTYASDKPCFAFDVHFKLFNTEVIKAWIGMPCTDRERFVCVWENDCIYQTCEEFLIMLSSSKCKTACTNLDKLGEITDLATCRSRTFALANFTVCHVYKTPASVTIGDYFSICYKPAIDTPLNRCSNETTSVNLSSFINNDPRPNTTCPEPQSYTASYVEPTTLTSLSLPTTDTSGVCECPCIMVGNTTSLPLTLEERIEILKKELTIDKTQTSKSKRKLISVSDNRMSAKGLGVFGLSILILVPVCIVLIDLTSISRHLDYFCRKKIPQTDIKRMLDVKEGTYPPKFDTKKTPIGVVNTPFTKNRKLQNNELSLMNESNQSNRHKVGGVNQRSEYGTGDYPSGSVNSGQYRPPSVLCVSPKTPKNDQVKVIYKDILDLKYQSSMLASRVFCNEVKSGKRSLHQKNVIIKSKDIGEEVRGKSAKNIRPNDEMPWINML